MRSGRTESDVVRGALSVAAVDEDGAECSERCGTGGVAGRGYVAWPRVPRATQNVVKGGEWMHCTGSRERNVSKLLDGWLSQLARGYTLRYNAVQYEGVALVTGGVFGTTFGGTTVPTVVRSICMGMRRALRPRVDHGIL